MMSGKEVRKALKINDISIELAAEKLGMTRQNLYYLTNKSVVDDSLLQNIKDKLGIDLTIDNAPSNTLSYMEARRHRKNNADPFLVPLVPYKARAGYIKMYDQVDYLETLEQYAIPPNVDPAGAIWRYFEVGGDSMEPTLKSGDLLLCSQVPMEDWMQLRNFYIYVLVTNNEIFVKRIYLEKEMEWILISDNEKQYGPEKFTIERLKEIWVVRRHIKKELPVVGKFDMDAIRKKLNG
jgi:phage repressor protein C with HTH and peptisase S24 domain